MRIETLFNDDWLFAAEQLPLDAPDSAFQAINLPHSNALFPHNNINNQDYQIISTYRKHFLAPADSENSVMLELDGVMMAGSVYLNNQLIKEHRGGFTPLQVDLSPAISPGINVLQVYVDSRERKDIPPYGGLVDYLTFGGIYRDVHLKILPSIYIDNVFIKPANVLLDPQISCDVRLNKPAAGMILEAVLLDAHEKPVASLSQPVSGMTTEIGLSHLPPVRLWDLQDPVLYTLQVNLRSGNEIMDSSSQRSRKWGDWG